MPQFLYRLQPAREGMLTEDPTPAEAAAASAHFHYLQEQHAAGRLILAGRTQNKDASTFGIAIFTADDEAAARAFMEADPAVSQGVMRAELFPYKVAVGPGA